MHTDKNAPSRWPLIETGAPHASRLAAGPLVALLLGGCVATEPEMDELDDTGEAAQAITGRDVGRTIANPNAQLTGRWLLDDTTAPATKSEFTSPISTPDGRLTLSHGNGNTFALGVIVAPKAGSPDYDAATGTVDPVFLDRMLVRDAAGNPVLTPIAAPAAGYLWTANTSEQMGLGTDPRLAGGGNLRIASAGYDTNCFRANPSAVTFTPGGPYECRRYLLFMPGKTGDSGNNRMHVAQIGVVLNAYSVSDPFTRLAAPTVIAAKFLSGFSPLRVPDAAGQGAYIGAGIELSATADSRLLLHNTGESHFTFSETPWDPGSWRQRRSLTCLATPMGTVCPGVKLAAGETCASAPDKCGMADELVCTSGRDAAGSCLGSTMAFRDKYPIAAYRLRSPDGTDYDGVTEAGVVKKSAFGGGYGWVSFDGSEFFFNGSKRSVRSVFGKNTRGVIKHIDNQGNVASARYCTIDAAPSWYSIANGAPLGACTEEDGMRQTQPLGMGAGLWRFAPEVKDALLPLSRRGPLFMMIDHNQLLGNYGPAGAPVFNQAAGASEHRYRHIYSEVALDDFADGDFVAYYHMNELIRANTDREDVFDLGKTPDTSGNFHTALLEGGAALPIQRWALADKAGQVNPGYLGRAVYLPRAGVARVARPASGGALAAPLPTFTVELAFKPLTSALWTAGTTTTLAEMPGFWKLSLVSDANGHFYPTLTMYKAADGAATTVGNTPAALSKSTSAWTHLTVTLDLSATGDRKVRFHVNGVLEHTTNVLPSVATAVPAAKADLLLLGPNGTGPTGYSYLLDEVAISRKIRDAEYIATAAFEAPSLNFDVAKSTSSQGPYLFSDTGVLPASMRGLTVDDLRIPQTLLNKIAAAKALTGDTWKARFEKIRDLGDALFRDDLLTVKWDAATASYVESKGGRACATCHVSSQGRAHQSVAFDKDILGGDLPVNSPTSLNRAFARKHFFDQRSPDLVDQVLRPIENTAVLEMGGNATNIASFINGQKPDGSSHGVFAGAVATGAADGFPAAPARPAGVTTYLEWFRYAFGTGPLDAVNVPSVDRARVAQALAAFVLSQTQGNSVVDRVRAGQDAATVGIAQATYDSVARGLRVFEGKGRCTACHSGSNYSDEALHASGPSGVPTKTPSLRRISLTAPYFRDASKVTLADVVSHYDAGGCTKADPLATGPVTCDPELYPLGLTPGEAADLATFLQNL